MKGDYNCRGNFSKTAHLIVVQLKWLTPAVLKNPYFVWDEVLRIEGSGLELHSNRYLKYDQVQWMRRSEEDGRCGCLWKHAREARVCNEKAQQVTESCDGMISKHRQWETRKEGKAGPPLILPGEGALADRKNCKVCAYMNPKSPKVGVLSYDSY